MQMAYCTLHTKKKTQCKNGTLTLRNAQCTMHRLANGNSALCQDYTLPQGESQPDIRLEKGEKRGIFDNVNFHRPCYLRMFWHILQMLANKWWGVESILTSFFFTYTQMPIYWTIPKYLYRTFGSYRQGIGGIKTVLEEDNHLLTQFSNEDAVSRIATATLG